MVKIKNGVVVGAAGPVPNYRVQAAEGRVFIRMKALKAKTGLPESTIYYLQAKGEFPRSFKLGERIAVWDLGEVEAWMEARLAHRDVPGGVPAEAA